MVWSSTLTQTGLADLVIGISDRVCVLDSGTIIYQGLPEAASRDEKVIEAYLGKEDDLAETGGG